MNNNVIYDRLEDIASSVEYNGGGISRIENNIPGPRRLC